MKALLRKGLAFASTLAGGVSAHAQSPRPPETEAPSERVVRVATVDPAMAAAIQTARASLPYFLALAERPSHDQTDFMIKVGLPYDSGVEYIWMMPFRRQGSEFVGEVSNTPKYFPGLKLGQSAIFDEDNIVDWAYRKNGVPQGHYTTCVLVSRLKPAERTFYLTSYGLRCDRK